jgi:hypothetical protein
MCEELGKHVNVGLLHPFTMLFKGPLFHLLGCDTAGL